MTGRRIHSERDPAACTLCSKSPRNPGRLIVGESVATGRPTGTALSVCHAVRPSPHRAGLRRRLTLLVASNDAIGWRGVLRRTSRFCGGMRRGLLCRVKSERRTGGRGRGGEIRETVPASGRTANHRASLGGKSQGEKKGRSRIHMVKPSRVQGRGGARLFRPLLTRRARGRRTVLTPHTTPGRAGIADRLPPD